MALNDHMMERGRGYHALFIVIVGAYAINTISLGLAIWAMTREWRGVTVVLTTLFGYLIIFVMDTIAKAVLITRDLTIRRHQEEGRARARLLAPATEKSGQ